MKMIPFVHLEVGMFSSDFRQQGARKGGVSLKNCLLRLFLCTQKEVKERKGERRNKGACMCRAFFLPPQPRTSSTSSLHHPSPTSSTTAHDEGFWRGTSASPRALLFRGGACMPSSLFLRVCVCVWAVCVSVCWGSECECMRNGGEKGDATTTTTTTEEEEEAAAAAAAGSHSYSHQQQQQQRE